MIKPKSKHTIRHILELPSSLPPSKRPAAKPPDSPWTKRRKLILPPVNKQVSVQHYVIEMCHMLPSSVEE
ncbi:neurogenic protein mastermind-like isoform X2 [Aphis craccivora]|uniref:Neurogenic protein mastermind-like isoform X2 n=1 Tax=Aphis craccivora TaxID=307492 RepID=A0A6G0Y784_APHCR|nr:neurogenic protein mastermind-like isoform X2 [Aphis craccivora]